MSSEIKLVKLEENPILKANFLSKIFFCWMNKFFLKGNRKELEINDLYEVLPKDSSDYLGDKLAKNWRNELDKSEDFHKITSKNLNLDSHNNGSSSHQNRKYKPRFARAIFNSFFGSYMLYGLLAFTEECITRIAQPIFLGYLIRYFSNKEFSMLQGYGFATGVVGAAFLFIFTHHPFFFGVQHVGMQIRVAACSLIYRKSLRLSQSALRETTIGQMVNLLSNDVNRFDESTIFLHYLWIGPIQTVIVTYILWSYFGPSCLVGVGFLLLFVPFQGYMGRLFSKMRSLTASKTDKRIRIMNEIINGMRVIKMYCWEYPFSDDVQDARKSEVKVIRKTNHFRAINMSLFLASSKIIIFLTLLVYVKTGNALTAEKIFVTLTLYNNIRLVMMLFFPNAVAQLAEALVSIKRLENFLLLEERPIQNILDPLLVENKKKVEQPSILIENLCAKWNATEHKENTLTDVNLNVQSGQLVAIIGHVGSGKGSLLHAILKELPAASGKVVVHGSIGYTAQEAWIFGGSLRDNILFGLPYDREWYENVIEATALKRDLLLLPYGDMTLVGDRGASLSGGQKARVALCRAVYANADIYLLDDPLSAVDPEVGRHIFEKCINGVLKDKIRILVTHQLQLLKYVNHIVLMESGRIQIEGTYTKLLESGIDFAQLLQSNSQRVESENECLSPGKRISRRTMSESSEISKMPLSRYDSVALLNDISLTEYATHEEMYFEEENVVSTNPSGSCFELALNKSHNSGGNLEDNEEVKFIPKTEDEVKSSGTVSIGLYWRYFRSGSNCFSLSLLILANILTQVLFTGLDFWLDIWAKEEESLSRKKEAFISQNSNISRVFNETEEEFEDDRLEHRNRNLIIYSVIVLFFTIVSFLRTELFFKICMDASVSLHSSMFKGIIHAPMRFFELNPLGRILNRFSKDIGQLDDHLPPTFFDALVIILNVFGILILIGIVNPYLLIVAAFLFVIFWYLRKIYLNVARSVKRLEGIARSPVFSHLSTSLYGLTTIRAFKAENEFIRQFDKHQNLHSSAWFIFICSSRWFGILLDLISTAFIATVVYSFMIASAFDMSGATVGLTISSALMLSGMFQWGVRQSAEVENQMVSVERVLEYTKIEPEAPLDSIKDNTPPKDWPKKGEIVIKNMELKYVREEPVLKNITLTIKPCEKVGIVGRTGAGKSSVISALFRIVEPSGEILIDGVNILKIGLHDLRERVSIIPQDPVLFTGTLRKNFDPFSKFNDSDIWNVLESIHLSQAVKEMTSGLDTEHRPPPDSNNDSSHVVINILDEDDDLIQ